ncbi:hypothetical protein D9M68_467350 [compost metagenome]
MLLRSVIPSLAVTLIYSEIGIFFFKAHIWQFNNAYLLGGKYRSLPFEYYLYLFSFSFFCLALYQYAKVKLANKEVAFSLFISNLIIGVSIALLFFAYTKWYTLVSVGMAVLLLLLVEYRSRLRFMGIFYPACLAGLVPFYAVQYIIANQPIITYQWNKTMDFGWFKIPFENHFQYLGMFLLGVFVLEAIKSYKRR